MLEYPSLQERRILWQTAWVAVAVIATTVGGLVWQQASQPKPTTALWPVYGFAVLVAVSLYFVFAPVGHWWPFRIIRVADESPLDLVYLGPGTPCVQHTVRRVRAAHEEFEQELPTDPSVERIATLVRVGILSRASVSVHGVRVTTKQSQPPIGILPTLMHVKGDNRSGFPETHKGIDIHPSKTPSDFVDMVIRWFPGSGRPTDFILYAAEEGIPLMLPFKRYELQLAVTGDGIPERSRLFLLEADGSGAPTLTALSGDLLGTHVAG